jgi:hypothetical protein
MERGSPQARRAVVIGAGVAMHLLAATGTAQKRAPLLGTVRGADGAPVANATVTVIEDDPDLAGVDPVDVLEATTDARGRFKVDALCGLRYAAVAVGPEHEGRARVALPVHGLACGRAGELVLTIDARRRPLAIPQLAAFGAPDALRVRLPLPHAHAHSLELPLGDRHALALPPLAALGKLELRDSAGAFLAEVFVPLAADQGASVPEPIEVAVLVAGADGRPVAGARVTAAAPVSLGAGAWTPARNGARHGPVAVTDAKGRAAVRCPGWRDPFDDAPNDLVVAAVGPDGREGVSGWSSKEPFTDWKLGERHRRRTVRIALPADAPPRGKAAGAGVLGRPARAFVLGLATRDRGGAI